MNQSTASVLWALRKGDHEARAEIRILDGTGDELRDLWNGELMMSQLYRIGEGAKLSYHNSLGRSSARGGASEEPTADDMRTAFGCLGVALLVLVEFVLLVAVPPVGLAALAGGFCSSGGFEPADQFRLLVRSEQPRLAQLAVHGEHDLSADTGHRLEVDRGRVLALVQRPDALRPQIVPIGPCLDDARPPCGVVHRLILRVCRY
jgi:hypothetical protein